MPIPYTDMLSVKKVIEFRKKGLSFGQIEKLMGKNRKTIYTWYKIGIGKHPARLKDLSTVEGLTIGK